MRSIRVHSSASVNPEVPRYLIMSLAGPGRLAIDLAPLEADIGLTSLVLSQDALYDVLNGQDLVLSLANASFIFSARGEELVVAVRVDGRPAAQEFRVWLAEVALGWNILARNAEA